MKLEGKIIQFIGMQEGISKTSGNEWKLAQYLLETEEQYPKKVCVEIFGEERIQKLSLIVGDRVSLNVDVESREFNGRWYTSVRAYGLAESETPVVDTQSVAPEQPVVNDPENSELPF